MLLIPGLNIFIMFPLLLFLLFFLLFLFSKNQDTIASSVLDRTPTETNLESQTHVSPLPCFQQSVLSFVSFIPPQGLDPVNDFWRPQYLTNTDFKFGCLQFFLLTGGGAVESLMLSQLDVCFKFSEIPVCLRLLMSLCNFGRRVLSVFLSVLVPQVLLNILLSHGFQQFNLTATFSMCCPGSMYSPQEGGWVR